MTTETCKAEKHRRQAKKYNNIFKGCRTTTKGIVDTKRKYQEKNERWDQKK